MGLLDSYGISRVPQYSGGHKRSRRPFAYRAFTFCGGPFQAASARPAVCNCAGALQRPTYDSHNPALKTAVTLQQRGLGCSPFARRYSGNRGFFIFLGVLRCFSSPGWLHATYGFSDGYCGITRSGLPHSEIHGSKPACGYPWLIVAGYVLRRLPAPRHSPCALKSLTYSFCEAKRYLGSALGCLRTHKRDLASADDLSVLRSKTRVLRITNNRKNQ